LPCTADSVVENTTFGSGFQIAAHSSIESSRKDLLVGRRPAKVAVRPDDVAVK
jgi:hypothetical protein